MINAVRERAFTQTIAPWKEFLELEMVGRDVDETVLMEKVPATCGKPARWLIRQGQYITVGELFVFGARRCSCWALYRIYKSSDIFIRKEQHSVSGSEGAVVLQNAKRKRHLDTGKFGLDW